MTFSFSSTRSFSDKHGHTKNTMEGVGRCIVLPGAAGHSNLDVPFSPVIDGNVPNFMGGLGQFQELRFLHVVR